MKISLIMITKDPDHDWFIRSVNSILDQSYENFEIINIDASSAPLPEVQDKRFFSFKQQSVGLWPAFDEGFRRSSGEILGVLNSDDFLFNSEVLKTICFNFDHNIFYIYGNSCRVSSNESELYVFRPIKSDNYWLHRFFGLSVSHHTFYFRKEVLDTVPFMDCRIVNHYDMSFILETIKTFKGKYIDQNVASFRLHGANASNGTFVSMSNFYSDYNKVPSFLYLLPKLIWFLIRPKYLNFIIKRYLKRYKFCGGQK